MVGVDVIGANDPRLARFLFRRASFRRIRGRRIPGGHALSSLGRKIYYAHHIGEDAMALARKLAVCVAGFAALASCLAASLEAVAQDYPSRPLQLIVPFPPGGSVDIMGRGFAQALDAKLNQRVIVQNRGGAGLTIGMAALVQSPADGYTVLYSPVTPVSIQLHRMKGLPYTRDSIVPVCQTFENLFYVAVGPKSPLQSMQQLLEVAKASPGKLRYGVPGLGGSPHLAAAELWMKAGVQLQDVPYSGEIVFAPHLLTNELDIGIATTTLVVAQKLRPLAVYAAERQKQFPNVPTVAELGYPILPSGYGGLFVRAGTPAPVVARLEQACRDATADPGYRTLTEKQFQQADYLDRAAFTARLDADTRAKATLIPTLKIPTE
jgi:tripartite-type tricarboxylate transporter receptor subunit TctC